MPGFVWPKATTYSRPQSQFQSTAQVRGAHEHSIRRFKTGCLRTWNERDRQTEAAAVHHRCHTPVACMCTASAAFCSEMQQTKGEVPATYNLSLYLSVSHTRADTHTHTHTLSNSANRCKL